MTSALLIVDDDDLTGDTLQVLLRCMGYATLRAHDPDSGLDLFRQHAPYAVITDNQMAADPMAGLQMAARMKQESPAIPVIMLSGNPPREAEGVCDVVLAKPVVAQRLRATLHRMGLFPCM